MRNIRTGDELKYSLLVLHLTECDGIDEGEGTPLRASLREIAKLLERNESFDGGFDQAALQTPKIDAPSNRTQLGRTTPEMAKKHGVFAVVAATDCEPSLPRLVSQMIHFLTQEPG